MKNNKLTIVISNKINHFIKKIIKNFNKVNYFKNFSNKKFFKNNKFFKTSNFNKSLIFLILLLFSSLFYLSIPAFYDYESVHKQLETKVFEEFDLHISLSKDIKYRIMPSPNFLITKNIIKSSVSSTKNNYGEANKIKVYISGLNLFNLKNIKLKHIIIEDAIFNIDKSKWENLIQYLSKKISEKKIVIKKSKIFLKSKEKTLAIFTIDNYKMFYNSKNNRTSINYDGTAFNAPINFKWYRDFSTPDKSYSMLKIKELNTTIKSNLFKKKTNNTNEYEIKNAINFLGSKIFINFLVNDNSIKLFSENSTLVNKDFGLKGSINLRPFIFNINLDFEKIDFGKLLNIDSLLKNLLEKNIISHHNFNGSIFAKINNIGRSKIFSKANIFVNFKNGKVNLDNTELYLKNYASIKFFNTKIVEIKKISLLTASAVLIINNNNKFFQRFQVLKKNRVPVKEIYFEIEKNLTSDEFKILNMKIISSKKNYPKENFEDFLTLYNQDKNSQTTGLIKLNYFFNKIFNTIK